MIDLHVHTNNSDGQYSAADTVSIAAAAGIKILSITDHDTVSGVAEEDRANLSAAVQGMKELLYQYKTLLFDVNVGNAKRSDIEALTAANVEYGPLITSVSEAIGLSIDQAKLIEADSAAVAAAALNANAVTFTIMNILVAAISMVLAVYVSGVIAKPLKTIAAFMKQASIASSITVSRQGAAASIPTLDEVLKRSLN